MDLGCGNGAMCGALSAAGFETTGCDPSDDGIRLARSRFPSITFHQLSVYDVPVDLEMEHFDVIVSTEVIEHLYNPRALPRMAHRLLKPGGYLVVSTPYHGYLKNLALAVTGRLDAHFTALWDGGHIKFWSRTTLSKLLDEEGLTVIDFLGAGRIPFFWKSMILVAQRR